ncbi:toll/interleukin-1 receptor domain-containing protein [Dyella sp. C11]|uniref:toll/interleukin-1 receptor domain-containing protein n=1 Tax=Dyella sp. C11 TaxID=2126991 RepID=UPI000D64BE17|nr:toll/interleukin-1 receptor domain-containing protein [Dyella sp. C11]
MRQSPATPAFRYRAFISYSHRDASWAGWLHRSLETYRVPSRLVGVRTAAGITPRRLTPIFRDREELASANDLGSKVREALAQSANLIVICSPASAASRWVQQEVLAYQQLGHGGRIFCLIVDGEPGVEGQECFAPALRSGATPIEPIAADVRAGKDGRRNAKLKLLAGLLDVSFDSLKRRELQRRNRRLTLITAAALLVAMVTGALAIVATKARHAAELARADAERRQHQAEDLVDFMLGDLSDKLHQVERLDIMEDVDDRAMKYFASMPTNDVTDQVLAHRVKAMEKIGAVQREQGHLAEAIVSFEAAARLAASLAEKAPADVPRQVQWARLLSFIGQSHWFEGELEKAKINFDAGKHVLERAAPYAHDDPDWLFGLEMLDNNLGHVLEAQGHLDDAAAPYASALALSGKLVAIDPSRAEWTSELGGAHNNIGKLALLRGDLARAIEEYAADDAIETALAAKHPDDINQRDAMLGVRAILGRTLALAGADDDGMHHLQQSVDMAEHLVADNPDNDGFQEDVSRGATQLARLKRLNGDLASAKEWTAKSVAIATKLAQESPTDALLQRFRAEALNEQAAETLASGHADEAHAQALVAMDVLKPLLAKQPHERSLVLDSMDAQLLLAASSANQADAESWRANVIALARGQLGGGNDPRLVAREAQARLALGHDVAAQPLVQQLWSSGYRDAEWLAFLRRQHMAYPVNADFQKRLLAQNNRNDTPG